MVEAFLIETFCELTDFALDQSRNFSTWACESCKKGNNAIHSYAMGREEQIEEREVLESIFPDEITSMSAFHPMRRFIASIPYQLHIAGLQRWKWRFSIQKL
jgi:hypothetical protein